MKRSAVREEARKMQMMTEERNQIQTLLCRAPTGHFSCEWLCSLVTDVSKGQALRQDALSLVSIQTLCDEEEARGEEPATVLATQHKG